MSTFLDKINPGKIISDGLLTILKPIIALKAPNAVDFIDGIQEQIKTGNFTKDGIKADIHAGIKAAQDFTNDEVDKLLDIIGNMVDDAFALADQWPKAFPPKAA